jgi:hypothetical protein
MGVVWPHENGVGNVAPDLVGADVERRRNLDVADVIAADVRVHQPRDRLVGLGVAIVGEPLDERARAITHPDNADANAPSLLKT